MLIIADEASAIPDSTFEAIEGNLAGGGRMVMISNPSRRIGKFFRTFHSSDTTWKTFSISAFESPNVTHTEPSVPGLATSEWIEQVRQEYGENSAQYKIRVLGKFASLEEGLLFSESRIAQAELLHSQQSDNDYSAHRLIVGLDPAGDSGVGDETMFCLRRGNRVLALVGALGLTPGEHIDKLEELLEHYYQPHDSQLETLPVVLSDANGKIGADVRVELQLRLRVKKFCKYLPVSASDKPRLEADSKNFDRVRDLLGHRLHEAFKNGLTLPTDEMLREELQQYELKDSANGKAKLTPKDAIRKQLGRSPDRADSLMLCTFWNSESIPSTINKGRPPPSSPNQQPNTRRSLGGRFDPFASSSGYNSRR
jgi:hypothetical protein